MGVVGGMIFFICRMNVVSLIGASTQVVLYSADIYDALNLHLLEKNPPP